MGPTDSEGNSRHAGSFLGPLIREWCHRAREEVSAVRQISHEPARGGETLGEGDRADAGGGDDIPFTAHDAGFHQEGAPFALCT